MNAAVYGKLLSVVPCARSIYLISLFFFFSLDLLENIFPSALDWMFGTGFIMPTVGKGGEEGTGYGSVSYLVIVKIYNNCRLNMEQKMM